MVYLFGTVIKPTECSTKKGADKMKPSENYERKLALSDDILLSVDKPARYIGGEVNMTVKNPREAEIRFCMCFPDVYEVGMSHLGIQIIYDMLNRRDDIYCERVYSPWPDLDRILREKKIPLFALESQEPLKNFDFLGITLQYEMCYTNVLQILDLAQIPIYAKDRTEEDPIVIGGGPCAYNPEPLADFFDFFYIGEGETVYYELMDRYKEIKKRGGTRREFLEEIAGIDGMYVPAFYDVTYNEDGTLAAFTPNNPKAPKVITKQVEMNLSDTFYPEKPLVPFIRAIQDRVVLEIQRGCIRGCRFCQAGMLYRPIRERNVEYLKDIAVKAMEATGHEEISLSSLSSSDYSCLKEIVDFLMEHYQKEGVNISLPSLRIDAFSLDVMSKIQDISKTSLTFAPEAGSQRMRNVINKGLTEQNILEGSMMAFQSGWNKVKLYFMLGLPSENEDDIRQIAELSNEIAKEYYTIPKSERNGKVQITVSTSFFVPKPFTPFQWVRMNGAQEFEEKRKIVSTAIKEQLNAKSIKYIWHDSDVTMLEGVLARGDRKISQIIYGAYKDGCLFDSWTEYFKNDIWMAQFEKTGLSLEFYTDRERKRDELLPWDFIDAGVSRDFLWHEYEKSKEEQITYNCRQKCAGCGARKFHGGVCYEKDNNSDSNPENSARLVPEC